MTPSLLGEYVMHLGLAMTLILWLNLIIGAVVGLFDRDKK